MRPSLQQFHENKLRMERSHDPQLYHRKVGLEFNRVTMLRYDCFKKARTLSE